MTAYAKDPAPTVAGLRTLGTGPNQAMPGNTVIGGAGASTQGLLSARPAAAAGNIGTFYYATDNTTLYLSTGSAWTKVAGLLQAVFGWYDVNAYGAVGDCKRIYTASITSGSAAVTGTGSPWVSGDVGKGVIIRGAGVAGAHLFGTISAYTDANHITIDTTASTTVSNATLWWGTDDSTALQATINAANQGVVFFHNQRYFCAAALTALSTDNTKTIRFVGAGGQRYITGSLSSTYGFEYGGSSSIVCAISGATPTLLTIGQVETADKLAQAGPVFEDITFEDATGSQARLVYVQQCNHGAVTRTHFYNGRIGFELDAGTGSDDASWWTFNQDVFGTNLTGLRLTSGTFGSSASPTIEISGGDFEVPGGGIGIDNHANASYCRWHDMKMDIFGTGTTGIKWNSGSLGRVHVQMEFHADVDDTTVGVDILSSINGFDLNVQMGNDSSGQLGYGVRVAGLDATTNKTIGMVISGKIYNCKRAVYFKQFSIGNTVQNLRVRGSSTTQIVFDAGANNNLVANCCGDAGSGSSISDSGTGNVVSRWINPGGISAA